MHEQRKRHKSTLRDTHKHGRRMDREVRDAIEALILEGYSAAQAYRELSQRWAPPRLPTLRTVQRVAAQLQRPDRSGTWTLNNVPAEEARVVLDVLRSAIEETEGRVEGLTIAESEQIVRLHHAAPDLEAAMLWRLARLYMAREARGEGTADLDCLLAFRPWSEPGGWQRYFRAVRSGWIVLAPHFVLAQLSGQAWLSAGTPYDATTLETEDGLALADAFELAQGQLFKATRRAGKHRQRERELEAVLQEQEKGNG
jgi:hypothetical protein